MRCLIITNHFYPESFRINDVAFEMVKAGYDVTVLTAIPDYPLGKYYEGYGLFKKRSEIKNGVKIVRAPIIPRGNGNKLRLMLNYISVFFSFICYGFWLGVTSKFDYIFVHDTSPAFILWSAIVVKKMQKIPLDLWILDMWPESLVAGGIRNAKVFTIIQRMMDFFYQKCDVIHISSNGFRRMLTDRKVEDAIIRYLPNWGDRKMRTSSNKMELPALPKGFIIMFAGNLGEAQNLENVLKVANKVALEKKNVHWFFLGNGRKKKWMERYVKENKLNDCVHLLGSFPIETMPYFFSQADVLLVSLKNDMVFNMTLPAKVQAYMMNKKPILAMLNGEGQDIIKKASCGFCANSDDIDGMYDLVNRIVVISKNRLAEIGKAGYQFYLDNFSYEKCMNEIFVCMQKLCKEYELIKR